VVVVTYEQVRRRCSELSFPSWGVIFLDEGHRIRNPDAEVTVSCKKLKCPRRFILSGSPIQNSLTELWSLMDFVYPGSVFFFLVQCIRVFRSSHLPGKLSTLPVFKDQFVGPIRLGGFSNATQGQLHVAYACAVALRDIICEHMLRRMKAQVKIFLPKKTDEVVLCRITPLQVQHRKYASYDCGSHKPQSHAQCHAVTLLLQRQMYMRELARPETQKAIRDKSTCFGIMTRLASICNHPHLYSQYDHERDGNECGFSSSSDEDVLGEFKSRSSGTVFGDPALSGKFNMLVQVLESWHLHGHRVLLFSQKKRVLGLFEAHFRNKGWSYLRMDGLTPPVRRGAMVDKVVRLARNNTRLSRLIHFVAVQFRRQHIRVHAHHQNGRHRPQPHRS
jgi:DNA excision repair protein ERCC-6